MQEDDYDCAVPGGIRPLNPTWVAAAALRRTVQGTVQQSPARVGRAFNGGGQERRMCVLQRLAPVSRTSNPYGKVVRSTRA